MSRRQNLISARVVNYKEPDWRPLERLASPYLASSFMWMFELATRRGERFHAYKHIETRCYVHIDISGSVLAYVPEEDRYQRYPAWILLQTALRPWWEELNAYTAVCQGSREHNGFYGHGIVDTLAAGGG
jgi:hypothetical protein